VWLNQRQGEPGGRAHGGSVNGGGGSQSSGCRSSTKTGGVREVSRGWWGEGLRKTRCKEGAGAKGDGGGRVPLLNRARR
jgi:hypothetical protein